MKLFVTVLAAGQGKRMNSDLPKVLHCVKEIPMIVRVLQQVIKLNPDKILVVVGRFRSTIQTEIEKYIIPAETNKIFYVDQGTPLGTGHAVKCTLNQFDGLVNNIILNGDVPLLQYETIQEIYNYYLETNSKILITAINLENPAGNGRIVLNNNSFQEIVEEKDCDSQQKLIKLVNCGIYVCASDVLLEFIPKISTNNAQAEYYLTDLVKLYKAASDQKIDLYVLPSDKEIEIYNVNTQEQLSYLVDKI